MGYRTIERNTWQDADGHTNVVHADGEVPAAVAAHAPESVEDTSKDNDLGPGTSAAEQKGLDPEGASTIEMGDLNRELRDSGGMASDGLFASSRLPTDTGDVTSSGAQLGSEDDLADQEQFRKAQADADEAAAKRQEERTASALGDSEAAYAEQVGVSAPAAATSTEKRTRAQADADAKEVADKADVHTKSDHGGKT